MTTATVKIKNPIVAAHASVSSSAIVMKRSKPDAPGERGVLPKNQTVASNGATAAANAASGNAALSGNVNFGSASGSVGGSVLFWGAALLVGYFVFFHRG